MFRRTNKLPQRNEFNLSHEQIAEDVEAVISNEEQREKLYLCLDEKPPQEGKFLKIEDFLKGTDNLETVSERLKDLCDEVLATQKKLVSGSEQIRSLVRETLDIK